VKGDSEAPARRARRESADVAALIDDSVRRLMAWQASRAASTRSTGLLNAQSYRLAHWRVASEEINYRRFFDVNQLAALRMEDPVVSTRCITLRLSWWSAAPSRVSASTT